jgi:chromosome segregation ATPase
MQNNELKTENEALKGSFNDNLFHLENEN